MLPGEGVHSQGFIILWLYLVLIYPHLIWSRFGVVAKWKYRWSNLCCGAKESHTVCNISQSTLSGFVSQISLGIISIHIYSGFGSVSVLTKGIIKPWSYSKLYTKDNNVWCLWMYPAFGCRHRRVPTRRCRHPRAQEESKMKLYHVSYVPFYKYIFLSFCLGKVSVLEN